MHYKLNTFCYMPLRYHAILSIISQNIFVLEQEVVAKLVIHLCANWTAILFGQTFMAKLLFELFESFLVKMELWIGENMSNHKTVTIQILHVS